MNIIEKINNSNLKREYKSALLSRVNKLKGAKIVVKDGSFNWVPKYRLEDVRDLSGAYKKRAILNPNWVLLDTNYNNEQFILL